MKKILTISVLALGLAGCNTTTYAHRPTISVGPPMYITPMPVPRPYFAHEYRRRSPHHCYSTWDRTPYGMRERRMCRSW